MQYSNQEGTESECSYPCFNCEESLRIRKTVLSYEQAREIFLVKPQVSAPRIIGSTLEIAKAYGVSSKTIRDIWLGRTWYRATYDLDQSKPPSLAKLSKKIGRPAGAKDRNPRKSKASDVTKISNALITRRAPLSKSRQAATCIEIKPQSTSDGENTERTQYETYSYPVKRSTGEIVEDFLNQEYLTSGPLCCSDPFYADLLVFLNDFGVDNYNDFL